MSKLPEWIPIAKFLKTSKSIGDQDMWVFTESKKLIKTKYMGGWFWQIDNSDRITHVQPIYIPEPPNE